VAFTYHGAVPVPGLDRQITIGPYESIPELARGFARVAMLLRDQGYASSADRFRFFGHVEEDGERRYFNAGEEAALGAGIDRATAYWQDRYESDETHAHYTTPTRRPR